MFITMDDLRRTESKRQMTLSSPEVLLYYNKATDRVSRFFKTSRGHYKIMKGYKNHLKCCENLDELKKGYEIELFVGWSDLYKRELKVFIMHNNTPIYHTMIRKPVNTGKVASNELLDVTTTLVPYMQKTFADYSFDVVVKSPVKDSKWFDPYYVAIKYFGWSTTFILSIPEEKTTLILGGSGKGHKWTTTK